MVFNMGDEVQDRISGFKGIVVSHTEFMHGCDRYGLQAKVGKDGKVPDWHYFDSRQLKLIKAKKVKVPKRTAVEKPGGPQPSPTRNPDATR